MSTVTASKKSVFSIQQIRIDNIKIDHGLQSRASMHVDEMSEFSRAIIEGAIFPPVDVYWDGTVYWLADGFHRIGAHKNAGVKNIRCTVHKGSREDAVVFSAGSNRKFSIKRSDADIRKAICMLLDQEDWFRVSGSQIARHVGCSPMTVGRVREEYCRETKKPLPSTFMATNGREQPSIKISRFTRREEPVKNGTAKIPDRYSLDYTYIFNLFKTRFGFRGILNQGKAMVLPGITGLYRDGTPSILMTPCEINWVGALPKAVGCLLLARQTIKKVDHLIILCYPDDGPPEVMKLANQLGIEFVSPEDLIKLLKGVTL